ncbi:MAG: AAA family ATPase, partial [Candidatus Diapherotrites archaeon]|nr:AAA family ATPase [Candidatus Diapherotrites archaeon]
MENLFEQALAEESIFKDRDLISPHYTPDELPNREKQIKEITSILAPTINAKKSNNLFIYGKVGTGKTSVTKHVLHQLKEFVEKNNAKVVSVYTNCRNHPSKYKVLLKCLKDLDPEKNFLGYSAGFVYEQVIDYVRKSKSQLIIVLDEIDKVKDLDDLVYGLTRSNDELDGGGISIIGISNNVLFKDRLDARTKSSLCEHEMVFPPYNAEELKEILSQRVKIAFQENSVTEPAISFAAAI